MNFDRNELETLLAEVKAELDAAFQKEAKLAKALPEDEESPEASAADAAEASAPAPEASAPPAEEPAAPPADDAAPPAAEDAPPGEPAGDEGGQIDLEALEAEYAKLPPEELEAHAAAALAALQKLKGGDAAGAPAGAAPPAAPPAGPEASAPAPAFKAELNVNNKGNGGPAPVKGLKKSEDLGEELAKARKEYDALRGQVDGLLAVVEKIVGQPVRKAVTSVDFVGKGETAPEKKLSKSEVTQKLVELTKSPDLKKSERELINQYYDGAVGFDKIAHLLK